MDYGEPHVIRSEALPLLAYIRFPQAENATDEDILSWVMSHYEQARETLQEGLVTDINMEGEINIHSNSYLVNDTYAGVVLQGMFSHNQLATPIDLIGVFNIDTQNGRLLANADILDHENLEDAKTLLRLALLALDPDLESYLDELDIDEAWFELIALGQDGLIIVLEKYSHFPGYIGTLTVNLSYEALADAILINWQEEVDIEPEIVAEPEEVPTEGDETPQAPPAPNREIDPTRPMIALTFDDGPATHTIRILEALERHNGRATFFVLGNLIESNRAILERTVAGGHEVSGHSWNHRNFTQLSADEIRSQILDTHRIIESVAGESRPMFRPPFGSYNAHVQEVAGNLGFTMINWSIDPRDWEHRDANTTYTNMMNQAHDGGIVVLHDIHASTADAMERAIPSLVEAGYQLVTVSELFYHRHVTITPGAVIHRGN